MREIVSHSRTQAPPPHVIWDTLNDPSAADRRQWLVLLEDEMSPVILEADRPGLVIWSSLWPDRPRDRIRFVITDDGAGSRVTWVLETADEPPDEATAKTRRARIDFLINEEMRDFWDL